MLRFLNFRAALASAALLLTAGFVFAVHPAAAQASFGETVLHAFNGSTDGSSPLGALVLGADGYFYGTASSGGAFNDGTLFKTDARGNLTILHSFGSVANDGSSPHAAITFDTAGNLYGTTFTGGINNTGTVYTLTLSGQYSILHSFNVANSYDSYCAAPVVFGNNGVLYGETLGDYVNQTTAGALFSLNTDGSGYLVQNTFHYDVVYPNSLTLLPGGGNTEFFGTFEGDEGSVGMDSDSGGSIVSFTPGTTNGSGTVNLLSYFSDDGSGVNLDTAPLSIDAQGNLYGAAAYGGDRGDGVIYTFLPSTSANTVLYNFEGDDEGDGAYPQGGVILASDGNLYGTTSGGGNFGASPGDGTLFSIAPSGSNYDLLYMFEGSDDGQADGIAPYAGVTEDGNGNLLGTTQSGGAPSGSTGYGTIYEYAAGLPAPFTLSSVSFSYSPVPGGSSQYVYVTLNGTAKAGGIIALTSSNPSVASVPYSAFVNAGSGGPNFILSTSPVTSTQNVTITATYNGASVNSVITVVPGLKSVTLSPASVQGGTAPTTANRVYFTGDAASNSVVKLTSSNTAAATVPSSVTIDQGYSSHTVTITTKPVTSPQTVTITASSGGITRTATLTVTPPPAGLKSVTLSPASTKGGTSTTANRVYWTGNAPANEVVTLKSSNTAVATVPSTVTIDSGSSSHVFTVTTKAVTSQQTVTITATCNGAAQAATLTVTP